MSDGVAENRRNWPEYNESLVKRGELYLTFTFLDNWDQDLETINRDKLGRKFEFPPSFIQFLMLVHVIFNLPYRQIEGFLRKLSDIVPRIKAADYATIWRRGIKLNIKLVDTLKESDEPVVIAIDSSGIKVTNRGEWMREKWKVHRGWIKVNISVNVKTKEIVGIKVTDETVSDGSNFIPLVEQSAYSLPGRKIEKAIVDGAFDRREIFDYLQHKHIQPVIKIRSNASNKARGSPSRAKAVKELQDIGYQLWKQKYGYGRRWAVETVFSSVKRISGEHVSATKIENMLHEAELKFAFYNILLNYR
jgi:hypothetical protein